MNHPSKPLLSIGIIFKNEIRCLERCVKSLRPLRDAVPCELVMADTGSTDGSRRIAQKYADIFFDFPWINDFAAARNAVMDRSSGEWFFTVDADEWLDEDISELTDYLIDQKQWVYPFAGIMVRNYSNPEMDSEYGEFLAVRLARMSTNIRYNGAIHESWPYSGTVQGLGKTILHHDGYAFQGFELAQKKRERNMALLQEKLAQDPDDVNTMLQCVESSRGGPFYEQYIRDAMCGVERKCANWERSGPPIIRYAVLLAKNENLPELEEWAALARELFPKSPYTTVDIAYTMFIHYAEQADYARAIPMGEQYLHGLEDYHLKRFDSVAIIVSTLALATSSREDGARAILADSYFHEKQFQKACEMIRSIDRSRMQPDAAANYMGVMMNLHSQGEEDMSPVMADLWEKIGESGKKQELRAAVIRESAIAFSAERQMEEDKNWFRHAYTLFLPLAGKCGLGTAAAILETGDRQEMERLLRTVDHWDELPITALERALLAGIEFPLADQPLPLETMDDLASRLAANQACLPELLDKAVQRMNKNSQDMAWARGLALAALRSADWESGGGSLETVCSFVKVERQFLSLYYAEAMLCEENISLLPPMHRFGWYCVQAFDTLDAGDKTGYVRLLHAGLRSCESAKSIVEFLTENTPELQTAQIPQANNELLELAEKVRTLLSAYAPDDPAVLALKQSPAYRRVAWIIEGGEELPQ